MISFKSRAKIEKLKEGIKQKEARIEELEKLLAHLETPMKEESVGGISDDMSWWGWFSTLFRRSLVDREQECHSIDDERYCVENPRCIWQEEFWPHGCESNSEFTEQLKHATEKGHRPEQTS